MITSSCTHRTCILLELTFMLALVLPVVWASYVSWASASEDMVCHIVCCALIPVFAKMGRSSFYLIVNAENPNFSGVL